MRRARTLWISTRHRPRRFAVGPQHRPRQVAASTACQVTWQLDPRCGTTFARGVPHPTSQARERTDFPGPTVDHRHPEANRVRPKRG
jgi:hypothetical protein